MENKTDSWNIWWNSDPENAILAQNQPSWLVKTNLPDALSPQTAHIPLFIDVPGNPPIDDCGVCGPPICVVPGICNGNGDMLIPIECVIPGGGIVMTGLMSSCMDCGPILLIGDCMGECGMLCIPPEWEWAMGGEDNGGECIPCEVCERVGEPIVLVGDCIDDWEPIDDNEFIESVVVEREQKEKRKVVTFTNHKNKLLIVHYVIGRLW